MVKYLIYFAVAALVIWSVVYVAGAVRRQWKGKQGCGYGGCEGCLQDCRHRE